MEPTDMIALEEEFMSYVITGIPEDRKYRLDEILHDAYHVNTDFDLHANQNDAGMLQAKESSKDTISQIMIRARDSTVTSNIRNSKIEYVIGSDSIVAMRNFSSDIGDRSID